MASAATSGLLRHIYQRTRSQIEWTDAELLQRFTAQKEEGAFRILLERHGRLVWNVCRHILSNDHDAEDAFQATFLVLARRAGSIRKTESVASWLHGVAYRISVKARMMMNHRHQRERRAEPRKPEPVMAELAARELQAVLAQELEKLPAKYRAPFILCCLENRSRAEAARELGWKEGTVSSRIAEARKRLQGSLARRGIALSAILTVGALQAPHLKAALIQSAFHAACKLAAGQPIEAVVGPTVAALVHGSIRSISRAALKTVLLLTLAAATGMGHQLAAVSEPRPAGRAVGQQNVADRPAPRTDLCGDPLPPAALARVGTVRFRPGGHLNSIAFTPDGQHLITHGYWSGINVWDAATGKEEHRFTPEPNDWIGAALPTPDGQAIVTLERAGQQPFVRIRQRDGLQVTGAFAVSNINMLKLTSDGRQLVGLVQDGRAMHAEIWDLKSGQRVRSWKVSDDYIWCLELSADGRTFATGGQDAVIRLWDMATGRLAKELKGPSNISGKLALSPDGKRLASLGMNEIKNGPVTAYPWEPIIRLWDVTSGKEVRQLTMPPSGLYLGQPLGFSLLAFSPDGQKLVTAGMDDRLRTWDVDTGREISQMTLEGLNATTLAFAPDGKTVALAGSAIRLVELATGKDKFPHLGQSFGIFSVALTPDAQTIVTGGSGPVQLWDVKTGQWKGRLDGHQQLVTSLRSSANGRLLLSTSTDKTLRIWDVAQGREVQRLQAPSPDFTSLAVTAMGTTVAVAGTRGTISLIEVATGKVTKELSGVGETVYGAAFTPDARTLIAWYGDHSVHVWDVAAARELRRFEFADVPLAAGGLPAPPPVVGGRGRKDLAYVAAVSSDGRYIAYGSQNPYLAIHDTLTGKPVHVVTGLQPDGAGTLTFSPDSRTLAWAGWREPTVHILEVATGKERQRFEGHHGRVSSLAFSADNRILVSGSQDTTALVWSLTDETASRPKLTHEEMATAWEDLKDPDAARAYAAMQRLTGSPREAIDLIRSHLRPVAPLETDQVERWIADLDSGDFATREAAMKGLRQQAELVEPQLRAALKKSLSPEVRRRLEQLLENLEGLGSSGEPLRVTRAIELLERLHSTEARQLLQELAKGAPSAWLTRQANR